MLYFRLSTIKTSVYRKATHTDKYLHFNSHHPSQHKRSVARTLLDRARKIPSTQHVVDALKINGYTDSFIRSCQNTTTPTPEVQPQSQTRKGFVTLPYIKGISEKIARTLNHFNVNAAHKSQKSLKTSLIKIYRQELFIKSAAKTVRKFISDKHHAH